MSWLYGKLQAWLAVAGAVVLAVAYAFLRGRNAGKQSAKDAVQKENQRVDERFRQIDSRPVSVDDAFSELRRRAKK